MGSGRFYPINATFAEQLVEGLMLPPHACEGRIAPF